MNANAERIVGWAAQNRPKLNVSKTKAIVLGSPYYINLLPLTAKTFIDIGDVQVSLESSVRNLGLVLDSKLTWKEHVTQVCKRAHSLMYRLYFFRKSTNLRLRKHLVQALLFPIIDYCSLVYCDLTQELDLKLQRLVNAGRRKYFTACFLRYRWTTVGSSVSASLTSRGPVGGWLPWLFHVDDADCSGPPNGGGGLACLLPLELMGMVAGSFKRWDLLEGSSIGVKRARSINNSEMTHCALLNLHSVLTQLWCNHRSDKPAPRRRNRCLVSRGGFDVQSHKQDCQDSPGYTRPHTVTYSHEALRIANDLEYHERSCGIFPSIWKQTQLIALRKTSAPSNVKDFRPIALLSFLSKAGFRKHHSTQIALLKVTDDIRMAVDKKKVTIMLLFDFSKAFDTISPSKLLSKLNSLGFSRSALLWIKSYFQGRSQIVISNKNGTSEWLETNLGVPQGSVLGPHLFSLYVNDLQSILDGSTIKYLFYANDLQIHLHTNKD
ncbi:hypothetical protein TSAR_015825 [Trichomalopsis sarcophagae]|uniref:Reverse transcriptase domain-containing protein n=1 Tax=Trichomalopsis sarcophagae TaxID=543379 RepID=A0A232EEI4_9HYME|nr:hypothetical protein TSAR_015825 [Trichomalopsis sarcophagae]